MVRGYEFPDQCKPLTADERDDVIAVAESSKPPAKVTLFGILFTGLKPLAAPHVSSDMVSVTGDSLDITLPPGKHDCEIVGPLAPSPNGLAGQRSCSLCEDGVFEFESPRTIPVFEQRAVEVLSEWFEVYQYLPTNRTMNNHLDKIGRKAGVERLKPSVLRHSYGVLMASKGFTRDEISSAMGFREEVGKKTNPVLLSYGRFCEGFNPFRCGAETETTDGRCGRFVKQGRCMYHHSD